MDVRLQKSSILEFQITFENLPFDKLYCRILMQNLHEFNTWDLAIAKSHELCSVDSYNFVF